MSAPRFFEILSSFKSMVDDYIFAFLPGDHSVPEIDLLYDMMRDYPSRPGKGLRPGLLMIFNRAFGGNDEMSLNTAAALELFQNWIVIHDDIEDQSDLRRGLPALHIKYGVALALNAGDALAGKMWELISKNNTILGPRKAIMIFDEFLRMYAQTTEGQHIELAWERNHSWNITPEDYFNMCRRKTAWYTCISPSWIGGLIAGADPELKDLFVKFGLDLGVAFQIQDDVLNLVGDKEKYGKEIGGDILEGKRTLALIDLLNKCRPREAEFIVASMNQSRQSKDPGIINDVLNLMEKYGTIQNAILVSQKLARQAGDTFTGSIGPSIEGEYRSVILDFIDFVVNREF